MLGVHQELGFAADNEMGPENRARKLMRMLRTALRVESLQRSTERQRERIQIHTCDGKGPQLGVDLSSNVALTESMDEYDESVGS